MLFAGLVVAVLAYSVSVGGDAWEATNIVNRYITSVAPALVVLAAVGLGELTVGSLRRRMTVAGVMVLTAAYGLRRFAHHARPPRLFLSAGLVGFSAGPTFEALAVVCLAVGVALVVGGVVFGARPLRLGWWPVVPATFLVTVLVAANAITWTRWWHHNAAYLSADIAWARQGLAIGASTDPDATVAVYAAGAIPYFDHRFAVDALGKVDPHIARERPHTEGGFRPGHDKFDLAWTVNHSHPDLFEQAMPGTDPAKARLLHSHGYVLTPNAFWVRAGSPFVDVDRLVREAPPPTFR